jgi:hypothetical protein
MLVYDFVESAVIDRTHDIVVVCYVYDGWLIIVVPLKLSRCWYASVVAVPVAIVPFDVFPEPTCVAAIL